jgi:alkylation response protein AidB-like acyl-CoA dehydrogenase
MNITYAHRGAGYLIEDLAPSDILVPEDMDSEQRMMLQAIRDFAAQEVTPLKEKVDARDEATVRMLFKKAADLGIYMAEVPEEYGGLGLSVLGIAGMMESRSDLGSLASTVFAHQGIGSLPLINFGTSAQVEKYLERLMQGEMMAAFALTEPSTGSDAMNIKTTAILNEAGTHYVVNGAKQWITNAGWADLFILFAKVDGQQFTAFLLERNSPGLTVMPNENLLGIRGSSVCALILEDVHIPVENVLGEIGKGHKVAMCTLNLGRMKMATNCVGGGKKALACAAQYAAEREAFGGPIAQFGLIRYKLAEMAARLYASQSMAYRTAGHVYETLEGLDDSMRRSIDARLAVLSEFSIECALSKTHGSEMVNKLVDETLQIHGGYGYSEEYAPAKMYRDWRITRIYEGTSEICRLSSMKALLRKSASGDLAVREAIQAAVPTGRRDSNEGRGTGLTDLRAQVSDLKQIFLYLLGLALERVGYEPLLDNANQQYLGSLADIAIEIYAMESTVLRVMKLREKHGEEATRLPEALARLYFEYGADRVRQEATEILANAIDGDELRERLDHVQGWLPLPAKRIDLRNYVAEAIVASNGALPDYANA